MKTFDNGNVLFYNDDIDLADGANGFDTVKMKWIICPVSNLSLAMNYNEEPI